MVFNAYFKRFILLVLCIGLVPTHADAWSWPSLPSFNVTQYVSPLVKGFAEGVKSNGKKLLALGAAALLFGAKKVYGLVQGKLNEKDQQINNLTQQNVQLEKEAAKQRAKIVQTNQELQSGKYKNKKLCFKRIEKDQQIKNLVQKNKKLSKDNSDLNNNAAEQRAEITQTSQELKNKNRVLRSDFELLRRQDQRDGMHRKSLNETIAQQGNTIAQQQKLMEKERTSIKESIQEKSEKAKQLKTDFNDCKKTIKQELEDYKASFGKDCEKINALLQQDKKQKDVLQKELNRNQELMQGLTSDVVQKDSIIKQLHENIQALQTTINQKLEEKKELEERKGQLDKQCIQLSNLLIKHRSAKEKLQKQIKKNNDALAQKDSEIKQLKGQIEDCKNKINEHCATIKGLAEERNVLQQKCEQLCQQTTTTTTTSYPEDPSNATMGAFTKAVVNKGDDNSTKQSNLDGSFVEIKKTPVSELLSTKKHAFGSVVQELEQEHAAVGKSGDNNATTWADSSTLDQSKVFHTQNKVTIDEGKCDENESEESKWIDIKPESEQLKGYYDNYNFSRKLIKPSFLLSQGKKIVFVCVHGTFSNPKSFGGDEGKPNTQELINFAKQLAQAKHSTVELLSFQWPGTLNANARAEAGEVLAQQLTTLVNEHASDNNAPEVYEIWTFAHSHGCNVVSSAAYKFHKKTGKHIDYGIHVASPTLDDITVDASTSEKQVIFNPEEDMLGFKHLYHFYGSNDVTQAVGSFQSKWNWNRKIQLKKVDGTNGIIIHNIRLLNGSQNLNHLNIAYYVAKNLAQLVTYIDCWYPYHYDLQASVQEGKNPLIAIRHENDVYPAEDKDSNVKKVIEASKEWSDKQKSQFADTFKSDMSKKPQHISTLYINMLWGEAYSAWHKDYE